jgi:ribA/ribD-fused uncharacterized protein
MMWEKETEDMILFWGGIFSNWHPSNITLDGKDFSCVEQYFMYMKARTFDDDYAAKRIMATQSPQKQKKIGRSVRGYDNSVWAKERFPIMFKGVLAKFEQDEYLQHILFSTGDKEIVEGLPEDPIWGIGLGWWEDSATDKSQWKGRNLLGEAIMDTRRKLM